MPYSNPKQATAVFLSIQRKKGKRAAEAWGRKHRGDLSRNTPYTTRKSK